MNDYLWVFLFILGTAVVIILGVYLLGVIITALSGAPGVTVNGHSLPCVAHSNVWGWSKEWVCQ